MRAHRTDDEQMDAIMRNLAPVGAQIAELHAQHGTPAPVVATIAPVTLDALALAAVLSRNDVALVGAVLVGSALHQALDTALAEVRGALSAAEIAEATRLAMSRDADTVEKRRARHSRDAFADAIKDSAAYIRGRLQHGDHVQQARRLAIAGQPRSLTDLLTAAIVDGRAASVRILCTDAEDLAVRLVQLEDAGGVGDTEPVEFDGDGGRCLTVARYFPAQGIDVSLTTRVRS